MGLKVPAIVFVTGLGFSALAQWTSGIDANLAPRSVLLSVTVLVTFLALRKHLSSIGQTVDATPVAIAAFVLWSCVTGLFSVNKPEFLFQLSKDLLFFFVFLLVTFFLTRADSRYPKWFIQALVSVTLISLIAGIYQATRVQLFNRDASYAITSLHGHKNLFGSFLFLSIVLQLYGMRHLDKRWKALSAFTVALALLMTMLLLSKAIWIALTVSACVYLLLQIIRRPFPKNKRFYLLSVLMSLVVINLFFAMVIPQLLLQGGADTRLTGKLIRGIDEERIRLWEKTYHIIGKYPLTGVGGGNWQIHFPDATLTGIWRAEDLNVSFQRPHNDLLWLLSEQGYIGFNLYMCFVLLILFGCVFSATRADRYEKNRLCILAAAICGYLVISFCDFPRERIEHNVLVAGIFAVAYKESRRAGLMADVVISKSSGRVLVMTAIAVSAMIFTIAAARMRSEYFTRKMYDARHSGDSRGVVRWAEKAAGLFYSVDPTTVPVQWYSGNAFMETGQLGKALAAFREAYEAHPFNRNVLNDLASALVQTGDTAGAKAFYTEASRISPRFDDPKLNLAAIYIRQKKYDRADSCLKTLLHDSERRSSYERIVQARP